MKQLLLAAATGAALLSSWPVMAEASYFKVALGPSRYSQPGNSATETAWNLAYGQAMDPNWGYELGYVHFGIVSRTPPGQQSSSAYSHALYAAGVARTPLAKETHAYAKVGLALIESKGSGSAATLGSVVETRSNTNLVGGIGLDYQFSPQVSGNIEYQYFGDAFRSLVTLSAWTVGLRYGF